MFYYFPALLFDQLLLLNQEFCVLSTWYFNLSLKYSEVHPWYFTIFLPKFFGSDLLVNQNRSMWFTNVILVFPCEILRCTHVILAFSAWLLVQIFLVTQCSSMCFTLDTVSFPQDILRNSHDFLPFSNQTLRSDVPNESNLVLCAYELSPKQIDPSLRHFAVGPWFFTIFLLNSYIRCF